MPDFFQRLNRELAHVGIWGRAARRLEEELRDHYLTEKAALLRQGKSEEEADALALSRLGEPVELAQKARLELDRCDGSLKARFLLRFVPLCMVPLTYCAFLAAARFLASPTYWRHHGGGSHAFYLRHHGEVSDTFYAAWSLELCVVPWLVVFLWMVRASYRPVRGWKSLVLIARYLAISNLAFASFPRVPFMLFFSTTRPLYVWAYLLLIFSQSLLLLIAPWRVRTRMSEAAKYATREACHEGTAIDHSDMIR